MRSMKIENVKRDTQFAFAGFEGHRTDPQPALLARIGGVLRLTLLDDGVAHEVRGAQRVLVDYDLTAVTARECPKDGHGLHTAAVGGKSKCRRCVLDAQKASRLRKREQATTGTLDDADAVLNKRDAARRIAEAKVDRLMASLEARGMALWQVEGRENPAAA